VSKRAPMIIKRDLIGAGTGSPGTTV